MKKRLDTHIKENLRHLRQLKAGTLKREMAPPRRAPVRRERDYR